MECGALADPVGTRQCSHCARRDDGTERVGAGTVASDDGDPVEAYLRAPRSHSSGYPNCGSRAGRSVRMPCPQRLFRLGQRGTRRQPGEGARTPPVREAAQSAPRPASFRRKPTEDRHRPRRARRRGWPEAPEQARTETRYAASPSSNGGAPLPNSAIRCTDPPARPSARSVGIPATRSSSRACRVVIAANAACERAAVTRPINTMNSGMSGSVIMTMPADITSKTAITARVAGVRTAASTKRGQVGREVRSQSVQSAGHHCGGVVTLFGKLPGRKIGDTAKHLPAQIGDHGRGAALGQPRLQPVRHDAHRPQRREHRHGERPLSQRPRAGIGDHPGEDVGQQHCGRNRGARDHHTACDRGHQIARVAVPTPATVAGQWGRGSICSGCPPRPIRSVPGCRQRRCACGRPNTSRPGTRPPTARRSPPPTS